jgi:hypothetical protein
VLLILDDGTNSYAFHYIEQATPAVVNAGDLELVAVFNGVADAGSFTASTFI